MAMVDTVSKINRILEGLIGCSLEFVSSNDLVQEDWDRSDLELIQNESVEDRPEYIQNETLDNCFGFPLNYRGQFAGLAVVRNLRSAKVRDLLRLAELITVALENTLEKDQMTMTFNSMNASNVIPLRPGSNSLLSFATASKDDNRIDPNDLIKNQPLLIKTSPGFPLQRIAIEIHQLTDRWALVRLEDLPRTIFDSVENLEELGPLSIYIPNLGSLTPDQQSKLEIYLSSNPSDTMPQIIAGYTGGELLPTLTEKFCYTELEWNSQNEREVTAETIRSSLRYILMKTREKVMNTNHRFIPFHIQYLNPESFH